MKSNNLVVLVCLITNVGFAQKEITWEDLADVTFEKKYFPAYDDYFLYPNFSSAIKDLDGKKVTITGYFLDIDPTGEIYVLSKGPMSSCFFCGIGGPETAMEVSFTAKPDFKMDDIITVTGTLKLNSEDVDHFNYILSDCKAESAK